jgi:hypothetical protein
MSNSAGGEKAGIVAYEYGYPQVNGSERPPGPQPRTASSGWGGGGSESPFAWTGCLARDHKSLADVSKTDSSSLR